MNNRQARLVADLETGLYAMTSWQSYGDVPFFTAARKLALEVSDPKKSVDVVKIEVRDENDPSVPPAIFDVEVTREARILNPRLDTDALESKGFLASVWDLITGRNDAR